MRIFTLNKILLFILFCTVALVWVIIENAKPLTVKILNNLLAENHIEVLNFDAEYVSLDHIHIPRLILKIEDSHIAIQEFNLELRDSLKVLKNQQINAEDIVSIKTQSVYVDLGDSFFIRQSQQTEESPATLQLNLAKLPMIDLGAITIKLPALDKDKTQQHTLKMDKLTLTQNGQLDTLWRFNDFPLFSLDASLGKQAWQFNTLVDLGLSYQGLESLEQYLILLNSKQNSQGPQSSNMLYGLHKQLSKILQPIHQQQVAIEGQWTANSKIDLISGETSSQQSIDGLSLHSPLWPSVYFAPQQPVKAMLNLGNYPVAVSLDKSKTTDAFAIKLDIAPLNYQLSPSKEDRNKLIALLADENANQIVHIINQLTPKSTSQLASIDVAMAYPIEVVIPLQNDDLPIQASIPDLSVSIEGLLLQSTLKLAHTTFNSHQQFSSDFDWGMALSSLKATEEPEQLLVQTLTTNDTTVTVSENTPVSASLVTPVTIDIKALFPEVPFEQLSLSDAQVNLVGQISQQQQNQLELSLLPSSNATVNNTSIFSSMTSDNEQHTKQTKKTSAQLGSFGLILNDTSTMTFKQDNTQLNLSPFTLQIGQLIVQQATQADKSKLSTTLASVNKTDIAINQGIALAIHLDESIEKSLERWLQKPTTNDITWRISKLDITKQQGKNRRQPLLALNNIKVTQQLNLSKGLLVGSEQWQLDTLNLSSYHLLKFADSKSPLSLAGQWTFDTDIETALKTLQKVQPLPNDFTIQGHSKLVAGFALSEIDNTSQFEMKIQQQLSSLSGQWQDKSFNGGDVFAQCQFNWQQIHDGPNTPAAEKHFAHSQLVCPQTAISLQQAKLGLSLTNLNLNADIELNKDGNKTPTNWLQQVTGLSETNVSLTASGDMLDGRFLLPEFVLKLQDKSYGYLLLQGLSLEKFLQEQPQVGVKANGLFDGVLPAELVDGKVTIAGGKLAARAPGGLIEVAGNPAIDRLELSQPYLELVFTALEHLNYSELASTFDMTPNGDAVINIGVKGNSRGVERPVHLNYTHQENLIQLYRSTQVGNKIQNQIEIKVQ
ncbi:YdbH domain-containing protein [Shewanella sp. MEBiC00475]|uniref:YdbH domain-containing protein n=1 Tax=Shewanella sp. MEBiC00475 TaxID=2575361 RepID=UPI0010BF9BC6|nr:YdbH domain-containing protein [Shewanella sp. MEBiC00475]